MQGCLFAFFWRTNCAAVWQRKQGLKGETANWTGILSFSVANKARAVVCMYCVCEHYLSIAIGCL